MRCLSSHKNNDLASFRKVLSHDSQVKELLIFSC
jgi:hypothetical protein